MNQPLKTYLFIDTCVIQAAGSNEKTKSQAVTNILTALSAEYRLAVSSFSIFENLYGLWGDKATIASKLLNTYEQKEVSNNVLTIAAVLGGLYHSKKIDNVDIGDKILASTALLENGLILTENHKDFPNPFFIMKKDIPIKYEKNNAYRTMDLAIYKANLQVINRNIEDLDK